MRKIAINLTIDRSYRRSVLGSQEELGLIKTPAPQGDDWVEHWISSLPSPEREIIHLLAVEEVSLREAASLLGLSHTTVRYHRNKAARSLRAAWSTQKRLRDG